MDANIGLPVPNELSPDLNRNVIYADFMLRVLSLSQRMALIPVVSVVVALSLMGNAATLIVNCRRKIRPFFRTCLLSLAFSDILTATFQSASYLDQLSKEFASIWSLGAFMCGAIPFVTTMAILVNSFTLVAIAMDRYMAVVKIIKGAWEPSPVVCGLFVASIWAVAAGVASPMANAYFILDVTLIQTDPANMSQEVGVAFVEMCLSVKAPNQYYYTIVFLVIFVPMMIAFLWLNAIIASEIWRRRRPIEAASKNSTPFNTSCTETTIKHTTAAPASVAVAVENRAFADNDEDSSTGKRTSETNTVSNEMAGKDSMHNSFAHPIPTSSAAMQNRSSREIRQVRMFRVILVIMITFIVCRLPTWIYLLYKLDNPANTSLHWVLNYSFGILSIFNGVVNPLLYTFLTETIHISFVTFDRLKAWLTCSRLCRNSTHHASDASSTAGDPLPARPTFYCSEDRKAKTARI